MERVFKKKNIEFIYDVSSPVIAKFRAMIATSDGKGKFCDEDLKLISTIEVNLRIHLGKGNRWWSQWSLKEDGEKNMPHCYWLYYELSISDRMRLSSIIGSFNDLTVAI